MTTLLLTLSIARLPLGYDCADSPHDYDCIQEAIEEGLDFSPGAWINWEDPYAHFQYFTGYTTESPLSTQIAKKLTGLKEWYLSEFGSDIPALALVGGRIFILSESHKPYFAAHERRCPECVQFVDRYETDDMTQQLIAMRLAYMWAEGLIDDTSPYDTVLYYRVPAVWSEYRSAPELSDIVLAYPETPGKTFVEKWLLTPHDLKYLRMVGPSPELPEYEPEAVEPVNAWQAAVRSWVRAHGYDSIEEFIQAEGWIPGSRSAIDMQYGPLRGALSSYSWDTYTHRYGVSRAPEGRAMEVYDDEMERMKADYNAANNAVNEFTNTAVRLDMVFGRGNL